MQNYWLKNTLSFTLGWLLGLLALRIIRNNGIRSYMLSIHVKYSFINVLLFILVISVIGGIIFGTIQYYNEHFSTKKISFQVLLIKMLTIHLTVMLLLFFLVYSIIEQSKVNTVDTFRDFIFNQTTVVTFFYSLFINASIVFVIHLNKLLGKGNLVKLISGQFYKPKEEFRAFMFLDLQSSTKIAEKLGHIKYSEFLQDCFHDLLAVEETKVEIYQYVGDEVVLTLKLSKNSDLTKILLAFYLYKKRLQSKKKYYKLKYNVIPIFTAGLHIGFVTVAEVGSLKREIAYHGDTLNVASRIQGECKTYEREFLVSEKVIDYFQSKIEFNYEKLEALTLRGKKESTLLYAISPNKS